MSTGGSTLYFLDPSDFRMTGQVGVHDETGPVGMLNELEYIEGEVYANVWKTEKVARINPETGSVTGWIKLDGLLSAEDYDQPVDVLNGIAYDGENDRMFVTGKLWPKLFEITLVPIR
jgi:glutamine cyclotransferase